MIASSIGKAFLEFYNQEYKSDLTIDEFFKGEFVPLVFDHPNYMIPGGNSPLENPKIKKGKRPGAEERAIRINKFYEKISTDPAGSSGIGYPSMNLSAETSGQITNLNLPIDEENIMFSWIGGCLGIGVQGGLSVLFNNYKIFKTIYEGWQLYREYLNTTPELRPNQINTWNGQWLAHTYGSRYNPEVPTADFQPLDNSKEGGLEVVTESWVKVLLGIARKFPEEKLTGYVYNLGQTNTTIGFIPFNLPKLNRPLQIYKRLFGDNQYLDDSRKIEQLFGTAFGFVKACQMGAIGVAALEPKGLRGIIPAGTGKISSPNFDKLDDSKRVTFNTYITWILAMLDNETLWEEAGSAAQTLLHFEAGAKKAGRERINLVKNLLEARGKRQVLECITPVIELAENSDPLVHFSKTVHMMQADNVPYFLTLVRLRFAEFSKKPEQITLSLN